MADNSSKESQPTTDTSADASNAPASTTAKEPSSTADAPNTTTPNPQNESSEAIKNPSSPTTGTSNHNDTAHVEDDTIMTGADEGTVANGTPAAGKKDNKKRKSSVPEHNKKTPSKKKPGKELHLDIEPGEHWWVRTRGYPAWPAVICDEEMLPVTLLEKRPVSAASSTGVYRADFEVGGKNARDRRYPVMYLATNEFNWIVNTDLHPFDLASVKREVEADNRGKKSKDLWSAYQISTEEHDLAWYKAMLVRIEKEHREIAEAQAKADAERAEKEREKEAKKAARSSKSAKDADGDVSMTDAGPASAKKADKKRKKSTGDVGDDEQATKKLKLKLNAKSTDEADSETAKKKPAKKAKEPSTKKESPKAEERQLTEAERVEQREKRLLYLRHRLQKGFLSRDQAPKEEDMTDMDDYFKQLVAMGELSAASIRHSKINKVLKAILKLGTIPSDDKYDFTGRSNKLLAAWNKTLGVATAEHGPAVAVVEAPKVEANGTKEEDSADKDEKNGDGAKESKANEAQPSKEARVDPSKEPETVGDDVQAPAASEQAAVSSS